MHTLAVTTDTDEPQGRLSDRSLACNKRSRRHTGPSDAYCYGRSGELVPASFSQLLRHPRHASAPFRPLVTAHSAVVSGHFGRVPSTLELYLQPRNIIMIFVWPVRKLQKHASFEDVTAAESVPAVIVYLYRRL